jgi:hypothetical protein
MTQHVVQKGESLHSISIRYSVDVGELTKANNIADPLKLQIGQVLIIPPQRKRNAQGKKETEKPAASSSKARAHEQERKDVKNAEQTHWIAFTWLEDLLKKLRRQEAEEHVQHEEKAKSTEQPSRGKLPKEAAKKKGSRGSQHVNEVKKKLKDALNKEPHVIAFNGVKLSQNEKKQITAAVACCEMSGDGFGSINADSEFAGRKFGNRGIETSYSRIVHIGLSYGIIQYSQDSGSLGILLKKMYAKSPEKFVRIFGGNNKEIAESLLALTNDGRPDLQNNKSIPLSGQVYWNKIRKTEEGKEIKSLSIKNENGDGRSDLPISREIRGKRVQPIPPNPGEPAIDIWQGVWRQRFLDAGNEIEFQEVQLECAVEMFMNPILPIAKEYKVRSAMALAFICACSVRGNPYSELPRLLFKVAKEIGATLPFDKSEDELKCVKAIADSEGKIGKVEFEKDEVRRAKLLLTDDLGFLAEDLYDLSTY